MNYIIVDKYGKGNFLSVQSAIDSINFGDKTNIFIKNGTYKEKIIIDKPFINIKGENKEKTILTFNDGAFANDESGKPMGTFNTASTHIKRKAVEFSAQNITIENSAGMGDLVGQAVALFVDCDKAIFKNCRLLGRQDTLLTAPMHEDIIKEPELINRQYFENCYIEGDVDFIFGGATAIFKNCEIFSLNRNKEINGYITAACTSQKLKYGYVFLDCSFLSDADEGTVYLGRPWREYAKTVFINCFMDKHINKESFSIWNGTQRHKTCYYAQYKSTGKGYNKECIADWTHILNDKEAEYYTIKTIFEDWKPCI